MRDFRDNAIDLVRIYAAGAVMLLHYTGYSLYVEGVSSPALRVIRAVAERVPGVVLFFAVSGFLAAHSCEKYFGVDFGKGVGSETIKVESKGSSGRKGTISVGKKDVGGAAYLRNRLVRILPPIWLNTAFNLIVLMLVAGVGLKQMMPWLLTQVVGLAWTPSFLKGFATGSVNGALWTVFVQLQMYCIIAVLWKWMRKLKVRGWMVLLAAALLCNLASAVPAAAAEEISAGIPISSGGDGGFAGWMVRRFAGSRDIDSIDLGSIAVLLTRIDRFLARTAVPYLIWFLIGAGLYCCHGWLIRHARALFAGSLLILACWNIVGGHVFGLPDPGYYCGAVTGCTVAVMALSLSYCLPAVRVRVDFTYELFLYHWIVLNLWIHYDVMHRLPWLASIVLFSLVSCGVSFAANRGMAGLGYFVKNGSGRFLSQTGKR